MLRGKRPQVSSVKGRSEQHNVINLVPTWIANCPEADEPSFEQCIVKAVEIADLFLQSKPFLVTFAYCGDRPYKIGNAAHNNYDPWLLDVKASSRENCLNTIGIPLHPYNQVLTAMLCILVVRFGAT